MRKYRLTNNAVQDLSHIWTYSLSTWSESHAEKYYNMLISACSQIGQSPHLGKNYEAIANNLKGFRIQRHIIFYIIDSPKTVQIVRVLHVNIDFKNRMAE
jgi:toxin ParE1/3/4